MKKERISFMGVLEKVTIIDMFSKRIELTYRGSRYNDTVFGVITTIFLGMLMLVIGLNDFQKVWDK